MTDQVLNVPGSTETATTVDTDQNVNTPTDTNADNNLDLSQYSEIIGEGKKYNTLDDALKGLINGQQHITDIESENREMREDLLKRSNAEELLNRINANQKAEQTSSEQTVDKEAIEQLVSDAVKAQDNAKITKDNLRMANQALVKEYGEKASEIITQKAQSLGVSVDRLSEIAAESPSAFFAMVGLQQKDIASNTAINLESEINTQSSNMNVQTKRNFKYYQELRKTDKNYYSPAVQNQYHKDAREMGDAFYE